MSKVFNVILSGGFGTRLWPLSTPSNPKQFLKIFNDKSLFQHTVERNCDLVDEIMILTNEAHYELALDQMNEIGKFFDCKVIEPIPRNTAPAITLAALAVDEEDVLFVAPSDHMIKNTEIYNKCVTTAIEMANEGFLVTFAIKPTFAETGYGYIELDGDNVKSFREKPDAKIAKEFFENGNFYWNSGMFCFKAGVFLEELKKHSPEIYESCLIAHGKGIDIESMKEVPSESVDYAVFEKSNKIKTISSEFSWNDLGNFDALINYFMENKSDENSLMSSVEGIDVHNCSSISVKKVFGIGVEGLNVIETKNNILIIPKNQGQLVKDLYIKLFK